MEELRHVACRMVMSRATDWDYRHVPALTDRPEK
jgi:hypothetical protein